MADFECRVCHAYATGFHFGVQSCQACCAFFRRAIALNRRYLCHQQSTNGGGAASSACSIVYTENSLCRACRLDKCIAIGMDKSAVQMPKERPASGRAYFTVSGLRRNKRFASGALGLLELRNARPSMKDGPSCSSLPHSNNLPSTSSVHSSPSPSFPQSFHHPSSAADHPHHHHQPTNSLHHPSSFSADHPPSQPSHLHHSSPQLPPPPSSVLPTPKWDLLSLLIEEEMRISERRRILFCEKPVASLLGMNKSCPFSPEDLRPLRFQEFRRSIRTHILLVYEWLRVWPGFGMLAIGDQITLLRKCVLYHTILDPCFLTIQIGDLNKFVLPNGGYVSTEKDEGWEDEAEITRETKMSIYWPFLLAILRNIIAPMLSMQLDFDEFVALKAIVVFQMTLPDISPSGRFPINAELSALCRSLHNRYEGTTLPGDADQRLACAERVGNLLLLLSPIFETANTFVESHHIVQFFDLWQMDSLMLQFLKNKT